LADPVRDALPGLKWPFFTNIGKVGIEQKSKILAGLPFFPLPTLPVSVKNDHLN
jgi:hypothetical protein